MILHSNRIETNINGMKLIAHLEDTCYPNNGFDHTRNIARGVVYDDEHKIYLIHLVSNDSFGRRDTLETPGGGVKKGETIKEALIREIGEELGFEIDNIEEIGRVVDYYNHIKRRNNNHYFLAHVCGLTNKHLEEYEKKMMKGVVRIDVSDAIDSLLNTSNDGVNVLVRNREVPILKIAQKMLAKKKK